MQSEPAGPSASALPVEKRAPAWKLPAYLLLFLGLVAIFVWQVHKNWGKIQGHHWAPDWPSAGLALALLLLCSLLDIFIWNTALGWFTERLPFRQVAPVYIWSYLARYIPGKVGSLVLRVALGLEVGRQPVPVLAASAVELVLRTASALLVTVVVILGWGVQGGKWTAVAAGLVCAALVCVHPRIMLPATNWALRKLKKPPITRRLGYGEVFSIFLALLARWCVFGLAFVALALAFYYQPDHTPLPFLHVPLFVAAAAGSWALGFLTMFPGGLGPAQWLQNRALATILPSDMALVLPVLFLLWTLLGEGLWALAAWILKLTTPPQTANFKHEGTTPMSENLNALHDDISQSADGGSVESQFRHKYGAAKFVGAMIAFVGWVVFIIGLLGVVLGVGATVSQLVSRSGLLSLSYEASLMILSVITVISFLFLLTGLFMAGAGQHFRATVDIANMNAEMLALMKYEKSKYNT